MIDRVISLFLILCIVQTYQQEPTRDYYELHQVCAAKIQDQIDKELHASLVYLSMAGHFQRADVAKEGFAKFFEKASQEESEHAKKLIDYATRRGNKLRTFNVNMPTDSSWYSPLDALQKAIVLENEVLQSIHDIHLKAEHECKDPHLTDYLETEFIDEQIRSIYALKKLATRLGGMSESNGVGDYLMDRELLESLK